MMRRNLLDKKPDIQRGKDLVMLFLKTDVVAVTDKSEAFASTATSNFILNLLHCCSKTSCTKIVVVKKQSRDQLDHLKDMEITQLLRNTIGRGISSVIRDVY